MSIDEVVAEVHDVFLDRSLTLGVAESCTGGLLGASLTDRPGSSRFFVGGIIAYSNRVKQSHLGVDSVLLETEGAVSRAAAQQMQSGLVDRVGVDCGISITGIAGPGGGTPEKPVGLVYIGLGTPSRETVHRCEFEGDRKSIRRQSVRRALRNLLDQLQDG